MRLITLFVASVMLLGSHAQAAEPQSGRGTYEDLVSLFDEFLQWKDKPPEVGEISDSVPWSQVEDWSDKAVRDRRKRVRRFLRELGKMNVAAWPQEQQAEFLAVRAKVQEENFRLHVANPWERDPGYYVDQMMYLTFTDLPVSDDARARLEGQLNAIPVLVSEAKRNLDNVAADYRALAMKNLRQADGVGHGHPYREIPPAGVIGWYDDFLIRAKTAQPDLVPLINAAREAVVDFEQFLIDGESTMTGQAGVGEEAFDWYLKNVKLLPYTSDEIVLLGLRELDRLWATYSLERHRNRNLPELEPAQSAEDYAQRITDADEMIRAFLVENDVITIPSYIKELSTNVPWIVRPDGRNFWEEVQFRDPSPDHLHAVIPGHRYDGKVEDANTHPIRGRISDGVRVEGWGVYLEEGMQHLGIFEDRPRTRELIAIFGIFRAARVPADVWLQHNEMTVDEVIAYWRERVPYLDPNVARVDAEIYLRRPPGYGLGYTIGMLQMQELLADVRRPQADEFVLQDFHDQFMAKGRLPMTVIQWEMTGDDTIVEDFWEADPLP
ncbi:MAG: DUF885 family protein [Pseudomonadota bacterium]